MAETLVGTFFNRPADALAAVSELLETYGDELGPDNATSMVFMALLDLFMLDRYAAAAGTHGRLHCRYRRQSA